MVLNKPVARKLLTIKALLPLKTGQGTYRLTETKAAEGYNPAE